MPSPKPVSAREFARLIKALGVGPDDGPFAVAVSGGADSMALALLFADWAEATFITFDHGLRKESAAEAAQVRKWLKAKGLSHVILKWEGKKPKSDIQAEARRARYQALNDYCTAHGIRYLVLGHTRDDQAETFLIRLFRGSGVDGLAAMGPVSEIGEAGGGVTRLRPFLPVPRARLEATLRKMGQKWIEDPANRNAKFTRVQVRNLLQDAKIEGLDVETLAKTADRMARTREALATWTNRILEKAAKAHPEGHIRLRLRPLREVPEEIGLRALSKVLMAASGAEYPPRLDSLERLYRDLLGRGIFKGATLMGAQLGAEEDGAVLVFREPAAITHRIGLKGGEHAVWDGRYRAALKEEVAGGEVAPLGEGGWRQLLKAHPALKGHPLPHPVRLSLPALWRGGKVAEAPHLKIPEQGETLAVHPLFMNAW